ncbi:hypothetical protein [Leptospira sarikeiensis]|uniref:Lipoprotein n=1 Tax=Leptospira sarikeiensis TaxID=2484943 RepID=A0A4R9K6Y7_9LEPT|nr:hypothetical protein [Leptospira sarikeiensis]TGL62045.1 hypothetical protein EHQ64_08875 [Leptospira sarikeiensis]
MKQIIKNEKQFDFILKVAFVVTAIALISILLLGCNNAKAVNIDASSSALGALAFDGNIGVFAGKTGPSSIQVNITGYSNLSGKEMQLTLTNTDTSETQQLAISENGTFAFEDELDAGANYTVDLGTYTGGQTCTLTGSSGKSGQTAASKIDCERHLAVFGTWFSSGTLVMNLFHVNQKTQALVGSPIFFSSFAGLPSIDLIWTGSKYLALWTDTGKTIRGKFFNIEFTAIGSDFPVASVVSTANFALVSALAGVYNPDSDEFAVVFSEFGDSASFNNAVRYIRLNSNGGVIGSLTPIKEVSVGVGTKFGYLDIVWDGSKYITAFEDHDNDTDDDPNNYVSIHRFTAGASSVVNRLFLNKGTGSTGTTFPAGSAGTSHPNFVRTSSDIFLFYNQANLDSSSGFSLSSSLMEWRNFSGPTVQLKRETVPGCNSNILGGTHTYVPYAGHIGNRILLGYDIRCTSSGSLFFDTYHTPINSSTGAAGTTVNYSGATIGSNITMGSSVTCRSSRCYTSAGALGDGIYILDPGFDGSTHTFFSIKNSTPGNSVDFPVQTYIQ